MENKKIYVIIGGLWFDKVNGNTYNTAKIIETDGDKNIYYTRFTYGYGSAYMQEAAEYIKTELKQENVELVNGGFFHITKKAAKNGWF